jgi:hypothetical protein
MTYTRLGEVYGHLNDWNNALSNLYESEKILQSLSGSNYECMATVYCLIATMLFHKQQYERSRKYCKAVLNWAYKEQIKKHKLSSVYYTLSRIARNQKQFSK